MRQNSRHRALICFTKDTQTGCRKPESGIGGIKQSGGNNRITYYSNLIYFRE